MAKAWDIVGYTFAAETYCDGQCVIEALPTGEGEAFDGWALSPYAPHVPTEQNLTEIAIAFGIDREDEYSFDSGDFPKVIFSSRVETTEYCAGCGGEIS